MMLVLGCNRLRRGAGIAAWRLLCLQEAPQARGARRRHALLLPFWLRQLILCCRLFALAVCAVA